MKNLNQNSLKKIFLTLTILIIILFITTKIFVNPTEKENPKTYFISSQNIHHSSYTNIESYLKVWQFLYTFKQNKLIAYELRRKIEKQDLINLLTNSQNFKDLLKSLNYDQNQKQIITELFGDEEKFYQAFYEFYFYLVFSQLDESKILEMKKQAEFIKRKIYRVDPQLMEKIRQKNDPELNQILQEIDKNLYQPNLSEKKINILISELNKINHIISTYESIKDQEAFKWFVNKRKDILSSLSLDKR